MIPVYGAAGLQTQTYDCLYRLDGVPNYERNLRHLCHMIDVVAHSAIEYPIKLLALAEGAIQGFPDELNDWDPVAYARAGAIDLSGPVLAPLREKAVRWGIYLIGQAKTRMPEFPDRFFNTMFLVSPEGEIIHRHHKNVVFTIEHSTTPHDVYDEWVAMFGEGLDAFFPVARTPIGNIGASICMEGNFPEISRGLALNGAEIIYRPSSMENKVTQGAWEIQNRARALDNTCYVIAPNTGRHYIDEERAQGFFCGGKSMIVDYRGMVLHQNDTQEDCFVAAPIHIEALRYHRQTARNFNWIPHIKSEIFRLIYDRTVWPANLGQRHQGMRAEAANQVLNDTLRKLNEEGVFQPTSLPMPASPR